MDLAFKQFIRSFLIGILLIIIPLMFVESSVYMDWAVRNSYFLVVWFLFCMITGFSAHIAVKNKFLYEKFVEVLQKFNVTINEKKIQKLPLKVRLPVMWSRCSKCISYSTGGIVSFISAAVYFHKPVFAAGIYFLLLGATLSSSFALLFLLRDEITQYKKSRKK